MSKKVTVKNILDPVYILEHTPNANKLKVALKKGPKGASLFAIKPIKKGGIIAYYKMMVYRIDGHRSVNHDMYQFTIYTKSGNESRTYIGDVYPGSLEPPTRGIPYWAYFSNEPSMGEKPNSTVDPNIYENYKNRSRVREGDTMVYKLVSTRDIKAGDEIIWCYGSSYIRKYQSPCARK